MDQVALIGPRDGNSLKWHILFNEKNNQLIERTFYVYCETPEIEKFVERYRNRSNLIFIPESDLLSAKIWPNKWIYQQLLKLSVDKLRDSHDLSELFLFTDVDTIPFKKISDKDLFHNGEPVFYISTEHEAPVLSREFQPPINKVPLHQNYLEWHYAMSWTTWDLLGIQPENKISAIDACVLWSQRVMKKLKRPVEEISGLSWQESILNSLVKFFSSHRNHFIKQEGFREISFTARENLASDKTVLLNELISNCRLGFSEWQLYAHFMTFINKNSKSWIGQMGRHPKPHIGEFNTANSSNNDLKKILDSGAHPSFIYFYPGIDSAGEVLENYCCSKNSSTL